MRYEEIRIGAVVKNLKPLADIPEGSVGKVVEFYDEEKNSRGITIVWCSPIGVKGILDGFNESELDSLEFLK